jgi:hypothetical protein
MSFRKLLLPLAACFLVAGRAAADDRIQVLLVEGASNHDWQRRIDVIESILTRDGSFDLSVALVPQDTNSAEWSGWLPAFGDFDVVVSGYSDAAGGAPWPEPAKSAFASYVSNGGGP